MSDRRGPPVPIPDERSAAYWAAAADHVLVLAQCTRCGRRVHPPGVVCTQCLDPDADFEFTPADGHGTVRSWTVIRDSFLPGFAVPFVLVDVELDEQPGLRMIGRLIDGPDAALRLGDRVDTVFEDIAPGVAVPAFALEGRK